MNAFNKRSVFDLTHEKKLSCDMGKLIPILCEEVVPGDTFKCKTEMLIRIAPMLAPVMHRMNAFTHFFFVPSRLLQTNWEQFITGGAAGTDATAIPTVTSGGSGQATGTLWDYFGLPTSVANLSVLAYPFRAYALIYNEWYRDQNLQNKVAISLGDGADTTTNMTLLSRNWEKDYFTSALPWPQRGTGVTLPLGTFAPVYGDGKALGLTDGTTNYGLVVDTGAFATVKTGNYNTSVGTAASGSGNTSNKSFGVVSTGASGLRADLSSATAATINDIRQAFQLQKWMELNARGGVRYVESVLAHFGIRSSDARLQRPEFLGGGRSPIVVSEVIQTSSTDGTSPQGNLAGHGFSAQQSHEFTKSFEEHGYIIGILSIMPRTAYQQGVPRMWNRTSKLDFYWPAFAHLGEQAILNKEIYAGAASPTGIFGYAPRYEEYRQRESQVCGDFRTTFNYWHMGRIFASEPALNSAFVTADPTKRINAVTDKHNCWVQLVNNLQAIRPIPREGIPGMVDH